MSKAAKRERQRQNREARREAELAWMKRRRRFKAARNVGLLLLPLVILFVVLQIVRDDPSNSEPSSEGGFATVSTSMGDIVFELDPDEAPKTAENFVRLADDGFYDGLDVHRVSSTGGVIQTGQGSEPVDTIEDELPTEGPYQIGDVAMANTGQPDSGSSQFFIITSEAGTQLPPQYSRFGRVVSGLDVAQLIQSLAPPEGDGPPTQPVQVLQVRITESNPTATTTTTAPAPPPS